MNKNKHLKLAPNTLYSGDCLEVMRHWHDACVDLIYLDPPFNSKANYNILFGKDEKGRALDERAQFTAFKDTWHYTEAAHQRVIAIQADTQHPAHKSMDGLARIIPESPMLAYVSYMAERVTEMHRILKGAGSLYLHCDANAVHYLKIALDEIFGAKNFIGEIIWNKENGVKTRNAWGNENENILSYAKRKSEHVFNASLAALRRPYADTSLSMHFKKDKAGRLCRVRIVNGKKYTYYADEGRFVGNLWDGMPSMLANSPMYGESMGYPTQKPLALLDRIITASSNEGDLVLDPFCGCGTTAHASLNLKRKFLGIDLSIYALSKICKARLKDVKNLKIMGLPTTFAAASEMDPFMFEQWAVTLMQGFYPNNKQTGDGGVDGRATLLHKPQGEKGMVFAQVKMGKPTPDAMRALLSQILGGKASMGVFITLEKMNETPTMKEVIRDAGTYQFPGGEKNHSRMRFWSIDEYFAGVAPRLPEMMPTREETQRDLLTE